MVSPFPYERWPSVPKRDYDLGRRLLRLLPLKQAEAAGIVAQRLLGQPIRLAWGVAARCQDHPDAQVAVRLASASGDAPTILITCTGSLALALADGTLGGEFPPETPVAPTRMDALSQGALVYLAARCMAALGGDYQVIDCLVDRSAIERHLKQGDHVRWPATFRSGKFVAGLALWIPVTHLSRPQPVPARLGRLLRRHMKIRLSAQAGRARITAQELAELACGDVVVPDRCSIEWTQAGARGTCTLHVNYAANPSMVGACANSIITVGDPIAEATAMTEGTTLPKQATERVLSIAGNAPVTLCLELARFTIPLEALAALRPGDILNTRAPIGQRVILRAGDTEIAGGELVDVEGEIGVRVTDLAGLPAHLTRKLDDER